MASHEDLTNELNYWLERHELAENELHFITEQIHAVRVEIGALVVKEMRQGHEAA